MLVEFENGVMIVSHESGHIDKYQKVDIEREKVNMQEQAVENQAGIAVLDGYISKIQNSIGVI